MHLVDSEMTSPFIRQFYTRKSLSKTFRTSSSRNAKHFYHFEVIYDYVAYIKLLINILLTYFNIKFVKNNYPIYLQFVLIFYKVFYLCQTAYRTCSQALQVSMSSRCLYMLFDGTVIPQVLVYYKVLDYKN